MENSENLVAPGLQVKAFVEYCPEIEEDLQDSLPLLIEEDIVDIPLVGYACWKLILCHYCFQLNLVGSLWLLTSLSTAMKTKSVSL